MSEHEPLVIAEAMQNRQKLDDFLGQSHGSYVASGVDLCTYLNRLSRGDQDYIGETSMILATELYEPYEGEREVRIARIHRGRLVFLVETYDPVGKNVKRKITTMLAYHPLDLVFIPVSWAPPPLRFSKEVLNFLAAISSNQQMLGICTESIYDIDNTTGPIPREINLMARILNILSKSSIALFRYYLSRYYKSGDDISLRALVGVFGDPQLEKLWTDATWGKPDPELVRITLKRVLGRDRSALTSIWKEVDRWGYPAGIFGEALEQMDKFRTH